MREFIELWAGLPPLLRFGVSILVLVVATGCFFGGMQKTGVLGWCVGGVILMFSFPSGPEKKGYHDF